MVNLPKDFEEYTKELFGEDTYRCFVESFTEKQPVSIRLNPFKPGKSFEGDTIPWCKGGMWLNERPDFTLDPLLHAGCYYVQEAASMFLDEVLRQCVNKPVTMLDLCAAPGGKSTLARAVLPAGSILYSNEPDRRRANILMENLQKQGHPDVIVTNNYAKDYQKSKTTFDVILADVPCSGEGMFRKDEGAIKEWSINNVMKCRDLQRSIIEDIWPCLRDGGLLIYSTCTFNTRENEENVKWISETLEAEIIPIEPQKEWNIKGSFLEEFNKPVYRFIPGITRTEGLFMAVLRKGINNYQDHIVKEQPRYKKKENKKNSGALRILHDGNNISSQGKERNSITHAEVLMINLKKDKYPQVELSLEQSLSYLRHEAIVLGPDIPKGHVVVCYQGHTLGFVKNIGNRANNLYPQEWRIRKMI